MFGRTSRMPEEFPARNAANQASRQPLISFLLPAIAISGAASMIAVRLATPLVIDEKLTAVALFFVLPGLFILAAGAAHRRAGLVLAALQPILWVAVARSDGDAVALWAIPVASAGALLLLAGSERRRRRRTVHWTAAAALCAALLFPKAGPQMDGTRAVLIGIDGASWQCVDAAVDAGRMPNIERMLTRGHRAKLRSLPSMLSPQVWSAIASGCPPSVNGIYGWASSQRDFRVGRVWDRMLMDGRSYGTCGWYFTWPPPEGLSDRHFVVPSTLAPDSVTFPPDCSFFWELWAAKSGRRDYSVPYPSVVVRALRAGVRLSTFRRALTLLLGGQPDDPASLDQVWRSRRISAAVQSDMFCELLRSRRPELGVILLNQVDKVSHMFWKYREPEAFPEVEPAQAERFGGAIEELYAEADRCVGKILEVVSPDAHVVIVSDHGFQPFLRRNMSLFCRVRTEALIDALDLDDAVLGSNLDSKTYLQARSDTEVEHRELLLRLEQILSAAHLKSETRRLFEVALEDGLLRLEIAPRNAVPEDATIILDGREHRFDALVVARQEARFSGQHAPDGVYIMAGPRAVQAAPTDSLSVLDVAPTLAVLLDLPMSPDWSGSPAIDQEFLGDLQFAEYPPPSGLAASPAAPTDERLREALRALGYLE